MNYSPTINRIKNALLCAFIVLLTSISYASTKGNGGGGGGNTDNKNEKIVSTFYIKSFKINKDGMISWTTNNEQGSLPFIVEQFIFDKWVKVAEVPGIGTPSPNSYSVTSTLHAGENKFRVRQKGYDKMSRFSDTFTYYSKKEPVNYSITNKNQTISFTSDTYFIIYNPYGAIVKQGYGNSCDISNYTQGYYCLIYDNKLGGFEKKKVLFKNTFCPIIINPPHWLKRKKFRV
ncbi:MAG: hypothetical protein JNL69_02490 [Bacteroidia bacterium]|nr:hypothetical protein [Bacteroidia bacterium]